MSRILVIGGAGYVGSVLSARLAELNHDVTVLDTYWYGSAVPDCHHIVADVRNSQEVTNAVRDKDIVIHLACISNDPSAELSRDLTRSVNYDCFLSTAAAAYHAGVKHFIYASSSSVYGVQPGRVTEDSPCKPLTLYSELKLRCEEVLRTHFGSSHWFTIVRPATVCGWSPRMRLDLVVNALTASAVRDSVITVHGGDQMRANLHIEDMVAAYVRLTERAPANQTYNVGGENLTVAQIAWEVADSLPYMITIRKEAVRDDRSYSIDSALFRTDMALSPKKTVRDAAREIAAEMLQRRGTDWDNSIFYNVKRMKELFP